MLKFGEVWVKLASWVFLFLDQIVNCREVVVRKKELPLTLYLYVCIHSYEICMYVFREMKRDLWRVLQCVAEDDKFSNTLFISDFPF